MRITKRTKTKDILPLLTKERLDDLLEQVEAIPLKKSILSMTLTEFNDIISDEEYFVLELVKHNRKALKFLGKLKSFREQMNGLNAFFKRLEIKQTPEETAATKGVLFPDIMQRMLLTCCQFFHLKSFEEAEKCTVGSYMLIYQNEAANAIYQRNYNKIIEAKQKNKKKK